MVPVERQKYGSMEQDRKAETTHAYDHLIYNKESRNITEERASSIAMLGRLDNYM